MRKQGGSNLEREDVQKGTRKLGKPDAGKKTPSRQSRREEKDPTHSGDEHCLASK